MDSIQQRTRKPLTHHLKLSQPKAMIDPRACLGETTPPKQAFDHLGSTLGTCRNLGLSQGLLVLLPET